MNVYTASYLKTYGYGAWTSHDAVITASTKEEALGLVLMHYPDTRAEDWTIVPVDMTTAGVTEINSSSS